MFFTTTKCAVLVQERSGVFPDLFLYCEITKKPTEVSFFTPARREYDKHGYASSP